VLLFFAWQIGIVLIALGIASAPLAKYFDRKKSEHIWGSELGGQLHGIQWTSGKSHSTEWASTESEVAQQYGPIFEKYGTDISMEEAEVLESIHRVISEGKGDWGIVKETDGKEYPCVTFRISSYPVLTLATANERDCASLIVTMEQDKETVKEYSLGKSINED